jgi:class 3 adenylate cyclase
VINYEVNMRETKLAIVLLDLIGSTQFVQSVGAARAALHFQYHDRLARSLIYKFEGREIDRSDGFLCSFDRTIDAVNFALYYQKTVPAKIRIGCRIGIHWGTIIEVIQDDVFVAANAKRVELEGISKNIAARTMSLCRRGQVLLTEDAAHNVKHRTNAFTPKNTRYACVGLYRFKGVKKPQTIYAVGETLESLQPPKGSEKVKRVGGPSKIKSRARDRKIKEWVWWAAWRLFLLEVIWITVTWLMFVAVPHNRMIWGIEGFDWVDNVTYVFRLIVEELSK